MGWFQPPGALADYYIANGEVHGNYMIQICMIEVVDAYLTDVMVNAARNIDQVGYLDVIPLFSIILFYAVFGRMLTLQWLLLSRTKHTHSKTRPVFPPPTHKPRIHLALTVQVTSVLFTRTENKEQYTKIHNKTPENTGTHIHKHVSTEKNISICVVVRVSFQSQV